MKKEFSKNERYMLYCRGFGDGAAVRAKRHIDIFDYDEGYDAGFKSRCEACAEFAKIIDYKPTILRSQPL